MPSNLLTLQTLYIMRKRKPIHFWQILYVLFIIFGVLNILTGLITYQNTGDDGWLALAFSGGFIAVCLIVVDPKFD